MIVSSVSKIPVSATHAIVGATLAASLFLRGNVGIKWPEIAAIGESEKRNSDQLGELTVASWFISPLIAGLFSSLFYIIVKYAVLMRRFTFEVAFLSRREEVQASLPAGRSPVLSGLHVLHSRREPLRVHLRGIQVLVSRLIFPSVLRRRDGYPETPDLGFDRLTWYEALGVSLGVGLLVALIVAYPLK